jgi:hypothetical protein
LESSSSETHALVSGASENLQNMQNDFSIALGAGTERKLKKKVNSQDLEWVVATR